MLLDKRLPLALDKWWASAALRELRRRGGKSAATCEHSRRKAVKAVEAFAGAARRVLYGEE